jgi:hypothetical protein
MVPDRFSKGSPIVHEKYGAVQKWLLIADMIQCGRTFLCDRLFPVIYLTTEEHSYLLFFFITLIRQLPLGCHKVWDNVKQ